MRRCYISTCLQRSNGTDMFGSRPVMLYTEHMLDHANNVKSLCAASLNSDNRTTALKSISSFQQPTLRSLSVYYSNFKVLTMKVTLYWSWKGFCGYFSYAFSRPLDNMFINRSVVKRAHASDDYRIAFFKCTLKTELQ